jgi:hypothetical protein
MGLSIEQFWYEHTPRQLDNLRIGYFDKVRGEHERRVLEARLLTLFINNSFADENKRQTFEEIYPLEMDKQIAQAEPKETAITLPIKDIHKMLSAIFSASSQ